MKYETIRAAIERQPYKPFSIHTKSSGMYSVSHPETILASPVFETVFLKYGDQETAIIDLDSIAELTYPSPKPKGEAKA